MALTTRVVQLNPASPRFTVPETGVTLTIVEEYDTLIGCIECTVAEVQPDGTGLVDVSQTELREGSDPWTLLAEALVASGFDAKVCDAAYAESWVAGKTVDVAAKTILNWWTNKVLPQFATEMNMSVPAQSAGTPAVPPAAQPAVDMLTILKYLVAHTTITRTNGQFALTSKLA